MRAFPFFFVWLFCTLLFCGASSLQAAPDPDYLTVSRGTSPEVSYRLDASGKTIAVRIAIGTMQEGWPAPDVQAGFSADKTLTVDKTHAKISRSGNLWIYDFSISKKQLGSTPTLDHFRWAFVASWVNPAGEVIQQENFLMVPGTPVFAGLGKDANRWQPFSLTDHATLVASLKAQIHVQWDQPTDGVASVVVENADGVRVRNLVSGRRFNAGKQSVVWDGLDEEGKLAAPGDYRWRAITHEGIRPQFLMSYYNPGKPGWKDGPTSMWLGDHSAPTTAASNGSVVALGCPIAESGNNIVLVDPKGNKFQEGNLSSFIGSGNLFLAIDGERFYAFVEGVPHYENLRKDDDGQPYLYASASFVAWNIKDGSRVSYRGTGKQGDKILREYRLDPALKIRHGGVSNLRGAVALGGALYVSLHDENKLLIINPQTGETKGEIALPEPGALASDGKRLLVYSGQSLVLFDRPDAGAKGTPLFAPALSRARDGEAASSVAAGLAFRPDGRIFVTDNGVDQNVKVYDLKGKSLFEIGRKGCGPEEGKWVPDSMRMPMGIALDGEGQLWVAENHPGPKRVSVWKGEDGSLVHELFGPAHYGASGAGFDTTDLTRWLGGASQWKIDIDHNKAQLESILFSGNKPGMPSLRFYPYSAWFLHRDGRTFLISKDSVMRLYEILPDQRAKLWAMVGPLLAYEAEHPRWWVPEVFTRHPVLAPLFTGFKEETGPFGNFRNGPAATREGAQYSVLWVDRNGDDIAQLEEVEVTGDENHQMRSSPWGYHYENTLDWKLFVTLSDKRAGVGELKFKGWLPSGAPDWSLTDAIMNAQPIGTVTNYPIPASYAQDSQGRFLVNGDPMLGVGADHRVLWTYPNDWTNVHGSHKAPLPETGVIQGALSYLGVAPFDSEGDVTLINGNHGRFFLMTTDGIYLDEMFSDVRLSRDASPYRIGGECFGGYFGRDQKSGRYILQSGHSDYRIFEILGLQNAKRQSGGLKVSAEQILTAQRLMEKKAIEKTPVHNAIIFPNPESATEATAIWGDPSKAFSSAKVTAWRDGSQLILEYEVKDPSPWVNEGKDAQLLFKTGDALVFEFSTDPKARPGRNQPAPGDKRLLIAPFEKKAVAILYDYRVPGTKTPVAFNSPWRSTAVDEVKTLDSAQIEVKKQQGSYTVRANLLLSDLGLPAQGKTVKLRGDFGVIYGDESGSINILRSYWSNPSTGLVNDVPGETAINPSLWGNLEWK